MAVTNTTLIYPKLPAEGAVELEVVLPAGLVVLDLRQRRQSLLKLLLVFPTVVKFEHGICLKFLLLCPLCTERRRTELIRNRKQACKREIRRQKAEADCVLEKNNINPQKPQGSEEIKTSSQFEMGCALDISSLNDTIKKHSSE